MPSVVTSLGRVHYEVFGQGQPMILLHGWLGSWELWRGTLDTLSPSYRMYALDFVGFGSSQVQTTDEFTVPNFVEMVIEFMDRLGLQSVPVIGHSMGGTVALSLALQHPTRVRRIVIIGSPINGSSLNVLLKMSGVPWIARLTYSMPWIREMILYGLTHIGTQKPRELYRMVRQDALKVGMQSFFQSIGTLHTTNLTDQLSGLKVPTLGIYGKRDVIVNSNQGELLVRQVANSHVAQQVMMPDSGHFVMIDEPKRFHRLIDNYMRSTLDQADATISNVSQKVISSL